MYPTMDRYESFGESTASLKVAQTAYPESQDIHAEKPVTGTDGKRAERILKNHMENISNSTAVDKSISIKVGK